MYFFIRNWLIRKILGISSENQHDTGNAFRASSSRKRKRWDGIKNHTSIQFYPDLEKWIDYLGKMLPDDEDLLPSPIDILSPEDLAGLEYPSFISALHRHLLGGNLRIKLFNDPVKVMVQEVDDLQEPMFELTNDILLKINIHPLFFEHRKAFESITVLEFSRFLIAHNRIQFSNHYSDNRYLPDIALHIFGFSDIFINGYEEAKALWSKVSTRTMFSQLRYEQHRYVAFYVDDIANNTLVKFPPIDAADSELRRQFLVYCRNDQNLMDIEMKQCRDNHPHFSDRDVLEMLLYRHKREFRL